MVADEVGRGLPRVEVHKPFNFRDLLISENVPDIGGPDERNNALTLGIK